MYLFDRSFFYHDSPFLDLVGVDAKIVAECSGGVECDTNDSDLDNLVR